MFETFLGSFANPANMLIGGLLVSSPILIHLINRMRFKRLRWAAMEFLLKSQKRNRRRLIIEQLILLLLRVLLVLLAGLLLARFLGANIMGMSTRNTVHVILVDDRLSMTDQWKDKNGERKNAFQAAKETVETQIAKGALLANRSAQYVVLRRLSEPNVDLFNGRLNDDTMKDLKGAVAKIDECTNLHLDLSKGIADAGELLGKHGNDQCNLYVVSDFRHRHWSEPEDAKLRVELTKLKDKVSVKFIDVADPRRSEGLAAPLCHDNLAVVELRPESRVAAQNVFVPFKVAVANYGVAERQAVMVTIRVNGTERLEAAQVLPNVPPGQPTEATFLLSFNQIGFNQVTAHLENEDYGLNVDNTRFAVVEVRKQVSVLIIDGDGASGERPGGDYFHLRTLFNAAKGFEVVRGVPSDLEGSSLQQRYSSIYLCNVRELSDKQVANLEEYVRNGGGIAFFMGSRITSSDFYNKKLYDDGKGLFPAPLADQPTRALTEEEKQDSLFQNLRDPQYQMFLRDPKHPVLAEANKYKDAFKYLAMDRYHPVPRQKWSFDPEKVKELITLPNHRPLADYVGSAEDLIKELPAEEPRYARFKPGLDLHRNAIRATLRGKTLYPLGNALEALLHDRGIPKDPERPSMEEFWQQPESEIGKLRLRVERLRDVVQLGDPLMITRLYGKGRVIAVLTSAGRSWNDWAAGGPASFTYPIVMLEMQKYLASIGSEANLVVGTNQVFELDATRYEPQVDCYYQGESKGTDAVNPTSAEVQKSGLGDHLRLAPADDGNRKDAKKDETKDRMRFEYARARKPGIYYFQFSHRASDAEGAGQLETRAFAYNVDTANESDLRRIATVDLERFGGKVPAGAEITIVAGDHHSDWSESGWLYLLFLIILIVEQAMAVHLSFHLKGNEAAMPAIARTAPA